MSTFDVILVSAIVGAFCVFGLVLAWGALRTASPRKEEKAPAE